MASRPVVPQQIRGEAVIGGGKQAKGGAAADARNRRALGDIGNLVTVRGIDAKANRPITRSFCAQLLANAQAAAKAENNKKQVHVNVDGAAPILDGGVVAIKKAGAPKPAHKKVAIKPTSEVIEISPDTVEKVQAKEVKCANKKKEGEGVSKKKAQTLTSVLTARSKAACGVSKKPKEQIFDIDAADVGNELAAVEYVEDIYTFYKQAENESRPHDYMDSQPEINTTMRAILVDWLVDVHNKFELSPETFYLTINIIDRFLATKIVPRRELQLVGIGAMLIASKYEEIWAPEVNDFVCLSDRAYTHEQILVMEKKILGKLEWTLTVPTPYVFLARFIKASKDSNHEMENLVYFLAELGIMHYNTAMMYCPSMIAASAVYAARCTLKKTPAWDDTLKLHTGFSEPQIIDCAKLLVGFHGVADKNKLQVIYRKYSSSERGAVALLQPAKALLALNVGGVH
ncbi:G2/mitotic-specific cyclin S13-7-like [Benincasa hispida]|uniref:G2/mitotic-specific cyclin S13-7-like n=1 Tax=Benincasa hispida TaxID=102211 RepID=UPI0018FF2DDC|nr:G2/mitotic-specific cyclin S13-7-like [Benincasa hispida]